MTSFVKSIVPPELWVFGEIAAVTGSQDDLSEARFLTCILRENLENRAQQNGEALIIVSALMERPMNGCQTYAEILFKLETTLDKMRWLEESVGVNTL